MDHRELEPKLATGKFRLNSRIRFKDLRLSQSDGAVRLRRPTGPHRLVQDTPSTRLGCVLRPSAGPAVADVERAESGSLVAVRHPTVGTKTFCAITIIVRRFVSGPGQTTLNSLHPNTYAWCHSVLAREAASTQLPAVQTCEGTLVIGIDASLPYSRSTWPRLRATPAAPTCTAPASSGSTTSRPSSVRATLTPIRPGPEPSLPVRCGLRTRHPDPPLSQPPLDGGGSAAPTVRRPGCLRWSPRHGSPADPPRPDATGIAPSRCAGTGGDSRPPLQDL